MRICKLLKMIESKISDFYGYPDTVANRSFTKKGGFQKNDCQSNWEGSIVEYSKTYTIVGTEQDLQNIIQADISNFNVEGQANANSEGTCQNTCPDEYSNLTVSWVSLCEGTNASTRYYTATNVRRPSSHEGITAPFSTSQKESVKYVRKEFSNNMASGSLQYNGYSDVATPNLVWGVKDDSVYLHNTALHSSCSLGVRLYQIPSTTVSIRCFGISSSSGRKSGSIIATTPTGRVGDLNSPSQTIDGNGINLYYCNTEGDLEFIGTIHRKNSDYKHIDLKINISQAGGVFVVARICKKPYNKDGNLGVWYSDVLIKQPHETASFVNLYPWNYSSNMQLDDTIGSSVGNEVLILLRERDRRAFIRFTSAGWGNNGALNEPSVLQSAYLIPNYTDGKAYLFLGNNNYMRYNWSTKLWE